MRDDLSQIALLVFFVTIIGVAIYLMNKGPRGNDWDEL